MTRRWRSLDRLGRILIVAGTAALLLGLTAIVTWWQTYWAQYVATNVLPPSLWTLLGIGLAHLQLHKKLDDQHEAMKQHVNERTGP